MVTELPPAIEFMLSEFPGKELSLAEVHKKLSDRSFAKDYFDQCLAGVGTFKYADRLEARTDKFDVYAGQSLDPLSADGKCGEIECRIAYAHQFARTACLYADRVVIPDPFSFTVEATDEDIFLRLVVLKVLKPLLKAGIIVFSPAAYGSCSNCMKAVRAARRPVSSQLWHQFINTQPDVFRFKGGRRWRMSFGSPLFTSAGDELRITLPATREAIAASKPDVTLTGKSAMAVVRQYRKILQKRCSHCAHGVVFSTRMEGFCHSTVATNTREEAVGYRLLDRRGIRGALPGWSMLRTIPLPALQRLNALQAMQVREEAEKAMPAFRAMLQRDLMSLKDVSDEAEEERALEVAADLRVAARELQAQLASVRLRSARRSEKLFTGLAVALEIVALSSGNPSTMFSVSGAFAALMLAAHKGQLDRQEKEELLVHQPAYVLLTAERIHGGRR